MARRTFTVTARWDEEAKVYYAESDIIGLRIEAPTLDAFEAVLLDVGPQLIVANHLSAAELQSTPVADLIPAILWKRPAEADAA